MLAQKTCDYVRNARYANLSSIFEGILGVGPDGWMNENRIAWAGFHDRFLGQDSSIEDLARRADRVR